MNSVNVIALEKIHFDTASLTGLEQWWRRQSHQQSWATMRPVNTGIGDDLRRVYPGIYPGPLSLAIPRGSEQWVQRMVSANAGRRNGEFWVVVGPVCWHTGVPSRYIPGHSRPLSLAIPRGSEQWVLAMVSANAGRRNSESCPPQQIVLLSRRWHIGLLYASLIGSNHWSKIKWDELRRDGPCGLCINLLLLHSAYMKHNM